MKRNWKEVKTQQTEVINGLEGVTYKEKLKEQNNRVFAQMIQGRTAYKYLQEVNPKANLGQSSMDVAKPDRVKLRKFYLKIY